MGLLRRPGTHTTLAAAYPVLALLAANLGQVRLSAGSRALLLSLVGAFMLYVALSVLLKDRYKAGLIATLLIVLFYTYEADIGDGLEDPRVHNDPPDKRELAMRMAVNILMYAITQNALP